ncbi:MAG: DegT/DnrJ/EryC1/StrS family aminotransferase [Anaerolineales bacterium]|nr:DegT/DnrJ/EryC1/StrS family aminotransferase [Anaerolineales bacterium]
MIPISKPYIGEAEKKAVLEVLSSGMLVQGAKTAALEERFAQICQTRYAIATSSGTTALHIALMAHGIGPGDEVITTPFTFFASISSILYVRAVPVFVDVKEDTFNIDPAKIEKAITPRTKAIMPVHLYGYPCEMDAIMAIAHNHNLVVIEDAAQAVGAKLNGRPVGGFGTGCFSLYATKNVMSGEGGMITTDDEGIAQLCRMIRNHGMRERYHHEMLGYNFRMTDIHASIGLAQLERLVEVTQKRRKNAAYYRDHITNVTNPKVMPGYDHVWHQYTIRVERDRDLAVRKLNGNGIGAGIFYPLPAYRQKPYIDLGRKIQPKQVTELLVQEVISIPVHPLLSQEELEKVVFEVNRL